MKICKKHQIKSYILCLSYISFLLLLFYCSIS